MRNPPHNGTSGRSDKSKNTNTSFQSTASSFSVGGNPNSNTNKVSKKKRQTKSSSSGTTSSSSSHHTNGKSFPPFSSEWTTVQMRNRVVAAATATKNMDNTSSSSSPNRKNTTNGKTHKPVFGPSPPPPPPQIIATSSTFPMMVTSEAGKKMGLNTTSTDGNTTTTSVKTSIGNIDLVTLASAVFPTDGGGGAAADTSDSGYKQGNEKGKGKSNSNSSSNNTSSGNRGNRGNNNNPPPPRNARDILYAAAAAASGAFPKGVVNGVVHCSTNSGTATTHTTSTTMKGTDTSKRPSRNSEDKKKKSTNTPTKSSSDSTNSSSTKSNNPQPCTEAEMKAFMNMFAEFVGIPSDGPEFTTSSTTGGTTPTTSSSSSHSNEKNGRSKNKSSKGSAAAAAFARENFARMNIANIAAAAVASNGNSSMNGSGGRGANVTEIFASTMGGNSNSSSPDRGDSFPAFSMMFGTHGPKNGNGHSTTTTTTKHKNGTTTSISGTIPPPPGGWPPGVAAAAAAAMAAAAGPDQEGFFGPASMGEWLQGYYDDMNDDEDDDMDDMNDPDEEDDDDVPDMEGYDEGEESIPELVIDDPTPPQDRGYGTHSKSIRSNHQNDGQSQSKNTSKSNNTKNHGKNSTPSEREEMNEMMHKYLQKNHASNLAAAELLREEEEKEAETKDDEEEKARRAAKKREKKNRKKEKAKREAAIKSAQTVQKRRGKTINSWKSRIVNACSAGEGNKLETLLSENPFRDGKHQHIDQDVLAEIGGKQQTLQEEKTQTMTWLLSSCMIKNRSIEKINGTHQSSPIDNHGEARKKLTSFITQTAFHVVFTIGRNGQSALHTSSVAGDINFVRLVVQRKQYLAGNVETDKNDVEDFNCVNCLDILSEDLGFSALHFAAIAGWTDVVEVLLGGGCNVHIASDTSLTCRISNGKGVTTRELLELIRLDKWKTALDCDNEDIIDELLQNKLNGNADVRERYLTSLKELIERLDAVEKYGFECCRDVNPVGEKLALSIQNDEVEKTPSITPIEKSTTSKPNRRKKKKKSQASESNATVTSELSTNDSSDAVKEEEEEDPMVTALIAMGFSIDQIREAVDACGGTSRATADDLVVWMLESENKNETGSASDKSSNSIDNQDSSIKKNVEEKQQRAVAQAKKKADEAAKREAEAKAAAERLAAKREEQRRIRREWNNREQLRQKEEAQAKIAEESRRAEIEKSKVLAQRRALTLQQTQPPTIPQSHLHDKSNVGATTVFPGTTYQGNDTTRFQPSEAATNNSLSQNVSDGFIPNMTFCSSPSKTTSLPPTPVAYEATSQHRFSETNNASFPDDNFSAAGYGETKKSNASDVRVNAYDFPVLAKDTAISPTVSLSESRMKGENVTSSILGQGETSNSPPLISQQGMSQAPIPQASSDVSFDTLPLGKIRATAREFVPSTFGASQNDSSNGETPIPIQTSMSSQLAPPGLDSRVSTSTSAIKNSLGPLVSSVLPPHKSNTPVSTILPPNTPFDRPSNASPLYSSNLMVDRTAVNSSPVASAASSVLSGSINTREENYTSKIGSAASYDNSEVLPSFLDATPIEGASDLPLQSTIMSTSSLGIGNSIPAPSSLSTDNIWGSSTTSTTNSSTSFNGLSNFNFASNTSSDHQSEEHTSDNWGSSMNKGGSIW